MRRYLISPPAIQDLQAITDYFAATSVEAGEKFLCKFESWCQKLRAFPVKDFSVRCFPRCGELLLD